MFLFCFLFGVAAGAGAGTVGTYVHISDMHLDLFSDPTQYSPAQFCRNAKFMPHDDDVDEHEAQAYELSAVAQRQWARLVEDGIAKHDRVFSAAHRSNGTRAAAALNGNLPAAPFGWQLCDSKPLMVDGLLADAAAYTAASAPDFVVMTGDWAAHLQLSQNSTITAVQTGAALLAKHFPRSLIVPAVGNNDVTPDYNVSCSSTDNVGMYLQWHQWIPPSQTDNFLRFGGFETRLHAGSLRIFSINTVLYHTRVKEFAKDADPCGQFAFLAAGLAQARSDGARVIITGHIPPKSVVVSPSQAAYYFWPQHEDAFLTLLHQYHDVITMTLWGHSHHAEQWTDERTHKSGKTTVVAGLMAPSITPLPSYPSYRVGTYDLASFDFIDFEQRYLNLQEANQQGIIRVRSLYTFSQAYGLPNLKPATLVTLRDLLLSNDTLADRFLSYFFSGYNPNKWETVCSLVSTLEAYWQCRFTH